MKTAKKYKLEVFLSFDGKERVRKKAHELSTSMAEIIKRALERFLS